MSILILILILFIYLFIYLFFKKKFFFLKKCIHIYTKNKSANATSNADLLWQRMEEETKMNRFIATENLPKV